MPVKWAGWGSSTLNVLLLAPCRIQHCAVTSSPCGIWHVWNSKLTLRFLWPLGVQPSLESQINLKNTLATGGIENAFYCGFVGVSWWQVEQRCYWMGCGDCSCGHRSLAGLAVRSLSFHPHLLQVTVPRALPASLWVFPSPHQAKPGMLAHTAVSTLSVPPRD